MGSLKSYQNRNQRNLLSRGKKKSLIWMMISQVIALVLTAFNQRCRFIYPSSGMLYLNPKRKMTGGVFHIIMKIGGRSCKIIVNSESCINDVSSTVIAKLGLNVVPHPHPYRIT